MREHELRACYRTLELPASATLEEVRQAYRLLSRVWHPDRFAGNADLLAKATARQQELNTAYQRLTEAYERGVAPLTAPSASEAAPASAASPPEAATQPITTDSASGKLASWVRTRPRAATAFGAFALLALVVTLPFLRSDLPIRARAGGRVNASTLAVGGTHACAAARNQLYCWGGNENGQRGDADPAATTRALQLELADTISMLAAGLRHTCALLASGRVHCWGGNYSGQLGDRTLKDRFSPARVWSDQNFLSLSALAYHTCGVTRPGDLYCWGNDTDGQLGVGRPVAECRLDALRFFCSDQPERVELPLRWRAVSVGGSHSCAIDSGGMVHCWGSNRSGQLGRAVSERCRGPDGAQPCRRTPGPVTALETNVVAVAAGAAHTCALDERGRAYCWGSNRHGQIGLRVPGRVNTPTALNTTVRFTRISAGGYHTCAISETAELYCWGSDQHGELRGEARERCDGVPCAPQPVRVMRRSVAQVAAGFGTTCIRSTDGDVVCWGRGEVVAPAPRPVRADQQGGGALRGVVAEVRWRAAAIKRLLHGDLVAPSERR